MTVQYIAHISPPIDGQGEAHCSLTPHLFSLCGNRTNVEDGLELLLTLWDSLYPEGRRRLQRERIQYRFSLR